MKTRRPRSIRRQVGMSLVEVLVAVLLLGGVIVGILPLLHRSTMVDRAAKNTSEASYVALQMMEVLKMFRRFQNEGAAVPAEFGGFAVGEHNIDTSDPEAMGVWDTLALEDPSRFVMQFTLSNDPISGRLVARVGVTTNDSEALAGAGGNKWVEFVSAIE